MIRWPGIALAAGASHTYTYDYDVPANLRPQTTFNHHAGVRSFQSADNTSGTFTFLPASNIDPIVTPAMANTAAADDPTHVATATPSVTLTRTTGVDETGNNDAAVTGQATIGERINYTSVVTIPQGTELSGGDGATYVMPLGTRQTFIPGTLDPGSLPAGVTAAYDDTTDPANPAIVLTFADGYTNGVGSGDDVFTIKFSTTVDDEAENSLSAGDIVQSGTMTFRDSTGTVRNASPSTPANQRSTQIVEPVISLAKDENDGDDRVAPGQVVRYTLTLSNANASRVSPAHETTIVDTLPSGVTPVDAGGIAVADGGAVAPDGGIWNAGARTITFTPLDAQPQAPTRRSATTCGSTTRRPATRRRSTTRSPSRRRIRAPRPARSAPARPPGPRRPATGRRPPTRCGSSARRSPRTSTPPPRPSAASAPTHSTRRSRPGSRCSTSPCATCCPTAWITRRAPSRARASAAAACRRPPSPRLQIRTGRRSSASSSATSPTSPTARVVRITYSAHVDDRREPEGTPVVRGNALQNTAAVYSNQTRQDRRHARRRRPACPTTSTTTAEPSSAR